MISHLAKMDRRSWLWRRKSSHKNLADTEISGSMSSHSERFFDDQAYPTQTTSTSPEVMSDEEEVTDVKILKEKLSAALLSISVKEDLIRQHANVAEEAISGWEKAEDDVFSFKQQLDAAKKNNSHLEEQVSQLDRALKECARQLRQAREEQEQKIHEDVANNSLVWESKKSELEGKVVGLEAQLQTSNAETAASICSDLRQKLEAVEKENASLKLELQSQVEELNFMITERDLSTQAAEGASKQHLESIMKIAKLEAERRRLKAIAYKTCSANDHMSLTASSVYVDSFTDSLSESGERLHTVENDTNECEPSRSNSWASALITELDQFKDERTAGKNRMAASIEINLMDDFLEMERLAALPDTESGSSFLEAALSLDQPKSDQNTAKTDLESLIQRNSELEEQLKKMEANRLDVEMELAECREQLHASQSQIKDAELMIAELQAQLDLAKGCQEQLHASQSQIKDAELKIAELQTQLKLAKECREQLHASQSQIKDAELKIAELQTQLDLTKDCQEQLHASQSQIKDAELKMAELQTQLHLAKECQEQLQASQRQLKDSELKIAELQTQLHLTRECREQLHASQNQIKDAELKIAELQTQLNLAKTSNQEAYEQLEEAKTKNEVAGSKLTVLETEVQELVSKIGSLEEEIQKERALSAEYKARREKLEDELSRIKHDGQLQREAEKLDREGITSELKSKQEKELSLAASRFAQCQRTIASLGQRLKSLETLEDLPHDSQNQKPMELTREAKQSSKRADQLLKSRHSDLNFQRRELVSSISRNPYIASEKTRHDFGKSFPRSKSVSRAGRH